MSAIIDPKAIKMLALALDPAAHEGEIESAAIKFVRFCRERRYMLEAFFGKALPNSDRATMMFEFGKYKGWPLDEIPTQYLEWAIDNITRLAPAFRERLQEEIKRRASHGR
jgi:hypothetical protein